MSCCAACYLRDRAYITQESLLVGIKYYDKAHLGHIQTLTQKVYSHQYIEQVGVQILNNLYSLQSVNIGVNISVAYACAIQKT